MSHLDRVAVWNNPNCSITYFDTRDIAKHGMTDEAFITFQTNRLKQGPMAGFEYTLINLSDVPSSRENRKCWGLKNGKIEIVKEKVDAENEKISARNDVLNKLGISEIELNKLLNKK